MRVLADTNILFSTLLFPNSKPAMALMHAAQAHELVLCDQILFELRDILLRKAPNLLPDMEVFLAELAYELVPTPQYPEKLMADPKDQIILNAAILAEVDIIISGDKHFLNLELEQPKVMTAAAYYEWAQL